jgi:methionine-rich copper-binding protein CopC
MTALTPRAALRTAGTGALLALLVAVGATPAAAHDQLLDSSPTEGEHLTAAPSEVTLRFSAEILTIGPAVLVVDAAGTTWTVGEPRLDGPEVVAELADDVPDGAYEVRWRVVSSDGHPIAGTIPFTVGDPDAPPVAGAPAAGAPAPEGSASTGAAESTATAAAVPGQTSAS